MMAKPLSFKQRVEQTPEVSTVYKVGLRALGTNSSKIKVSNTLRCEGSVNIDDAVKFIYAQSNRWDYCFCYNDEVFFVEVHPANTSEVAVVIQKLQWLKQWLKTSAPLLEQKIAKARPAFYWVQSGANNILKTSKQHRNAVQHGLLPVSALKL